MAVGVLRGTFLDRNFEILKIESRRGASRLKYSKLRPRRNCSGDISTMVLGEKAIRTLGIV